MPLMPLSRVSRFLLVGKLLCANINSCELVEMAEGHIGGWDQERLSHLFQTHKNRPFQIFGNSAKPEGRQNLELNLAELELSFL